MKINRTIQRFLCLSMFVLCLALTGYGKGRELYFYGSEKNDLFQLLKREGYIVKKFNTPQDAVNVAPEKSGVFI